MSKPYWFEHYLRYDGIHETKGPHTNPVIKELIDRADGADDGKQLQNIQDDETPYCSSALCGACEEIGVRSTRSAMARSWVHWGVSLHGPAVGAIVVFWRGSRDGTNGHVGMVAGRDQHGNLMVFGANQGDQFKHSPFEYPGRVLTYRWPIGEPLPESQEFHDLPLLTSNGELSKSEA